MAPGDSLIGPAPPTGPASLAEGSAAELLLPVLPVSDALGSEGGAEVELVLVADAEDVVAGPDTVGFGIADDALTDGVTEPIDEPVAGDTVVCTGVDAVDPMGDALSLALTVAGTETDASGVLLSSGDEAQPCTTSAIAQPHHTRCRIAPRPDSNPRICTPPNARGPKFDRSIVRQANADRYAAFDA